MVRRPKTRQRSKRIRDKAKQRKIRKKDKVNHRQIDKRKYYGIGVEIEKYQETMLQAVDLEHIDSLVQAAIPDRNEETVLTENIIDDIIGQISGELFDNSVIAQLGEVLADSFSKGSKRAYNTDGEQVAGFDDVQEHRAVQQLMRDQEKYFDNLSDDAQDKLRDNLEDALDKGMGIDDARDMIKDDMEDFTKNRAETTARSECIKASSRGTEQAMQEAGVEEVIWLATLDDRTCETCQDLHESKWEMDDGDRPMPVEDTHPNCRCTIVADTRS